MRPSRKGRKSTRQPATAEKRCGLPITRMRFLNVSPDLGNRTDQYDAPGQRLAVLQRQRVSAESPLETAMSVSIATAMSAPRHRKNRATQHHGARRVLVSAGFTGAHP